MLNSLSIKNFTTVEKLHLELSAGYLALTGETGAGKSVLLDAIALTLGERMQGKPHRIDHLPAEVTCTFTANDEISKWLEANSLAHDPSEELVIRRVIQPDGKSRAFINDSVTTLSSLKALAPYLIELHSQHAHYALLDKKNHSSLLDDFAQQSSLADEISNLAERYNESARQIEALLAASEDNDARVQLLSYQLEELKDAEIESGEAEKLEIQLKRLQQADTIQASMQQAMATCGNDNDNTALSLVQSALSAITQQVSVEEKLRAPAQLLESAAIQLQEAQSELEAISEALQSDPAQITKVETRLDVLYSLARKHRVNTNELYALTERLTQDLKALTEVDIEVSRLRANQAKLLKEYQQRCVELGKKRITGGKKLEQLMAKKLKQLSMAHCKFKVAITDLSIANGDGADRESEEDFKRLPKDGMQKIELQISTVPGKPPQSLASVASGGELSRISLAIQVAISSKKGAQTLVFDEVDVGIGGAVAEVVGGMIAEIGESKQLLCVTHLAQVAAKASAHYRVEKTIGKNSVSTHIAELDAEQRKQELARMMSGVDITPASLEQAESLLSSH